MSKVCEMKSKTNSSKKTYINGLPQQTKGLQKTMKNGVGHRLKKVKQSGKVVLKKIKNLDSPQDRKIIKDSCVDETEKLKPNESIFQFFTDLTNEDDHIRRRATNSLMRVLQNSSIHKEKRYSDISYTLKRLIRGCGAATNTSRTGFFTALTALLKAFSAEELPFGQIFENVQKELHVGLSISNKEDADAVVGKILTCGALIHSDRLKAIDNENLEQVCSLLLQSTAHKSYHSSMGYTFLIQLLNKISIEQFEIIVWPILHQYIVKPWSDQTINTVHCLIVSRAKFPNIINSKFMKKYFGGDDILNFDSYQYLLKIFWDNTDLTIVTHPAFVAFSAFIAKSKNLVDFWTNHVDPHLLKPTKVAEVETLKLCTDILLEIDVEQTNAALLLSHNFIRLVSNGLKNLMLKKDEALKAFYAEFFEALIICSTKIQDESQKVAIIRRLILYPGIFCIEKYTSNRIIHQLIGLLNEEGVKDIFGTYKEIFCNKISKNPTNKSETWFNFERQNAGYMLQHLVAHKAVRNTIQWRCEQVKFFMTCGLFYVNDNTLEICNKDLSGELSENFGDQMKNIFYSSLQLKLKNLKELKHMLMEIIEECNNYFELKSVLKYMRLNNFSESSRKSWAIMYNEITKNSERPFGEQKEQKKKRGKHKLQLVFHILFMHVGLQLFRETEMSVEAICDLQKCLERIKLKQITGKKQLLSNNVDESEPEWIEVVVDLFLHMLSHNSSVLRNVVNALFPHLCDSLSLTAVNQILEVLDMKDGFNPLSINTGEESEEKESSSSENDSSADETDDDEDEDGNQEEGTVADNLRNAVSMALVNGNSSSARDDDMDSIDLNDITEEEGKKLDDALAAAFKANKTSSSKKSKSHRVKVTTLMHFRTRVLDLTEIYLQNDPTLSITIEIMLSLYNMLEFCNQNDLKPLLLKVEKVLTKLTSLRLDCASESDVTEENIVDTIRDILKKKVRTINSDFTNRMRNKCVVFLTAQCIQNFKETRSSELIISLFKTYMKDFIVSRNPTINVALISDLFKLRWNGVWHLVFALVQEGIQLNTRTFRRIQIYDALTNIYKNKELLKQEKTTTRGLKKIERHINAFLEDLFSLPKNSSYSVKEFLALLELIISIHRAHALLQLPESALSSAENCNKIQEMRRKIKLDSIKCYGKFCKLHGLKTIKNSELELFKEGKKSKEITLRKTNSLVKLNSVEPAQKRKVSAKEFQKAKKLKKLQRLEISSKGLKHELTFFDSMQKEEN